MSKPAAPSFIPVPSGSRRGLLRPLLAAGALFLLGLAFAHLGQEVGDGEAYGFDQALLLRAQALRAAHPGLSEMMRDITALGSTAVLVLISCLTVVYLVLSGHRGRAGLLALSAISGTGLLYFFKSWFARARPDAAFADAVVGGWSFPSGHTSMSAIVFLTLGSLLAAMRVRPRERTFILATAVLLTLLVGISRVMLGAHWASDVLGGWAFGAAWALLCLMAARLLQRWRLAE